MDNDKPFHSITGASQMEEPKSTDPPPGPAQDPQPALATKSTATSTSTSTITNDLSKRPSLSSIPSSAAKKLSQSHSASSSPKPSRESSPVRPPPQKTPPTTSRPGAGRPRKNSKDVSPARSASGANTISTTTSTSTSTQTTPSAPAALSIANIPRLPHSQSDPLIKQPAPQKVNSITEQREAPRWPISPRLRSPPPISKPIPTPRKPEQDPPSINVHRATPTAEIQEHKGLDTRVEQSLEALGTKAPSRGVSGASSTLETVQEVSQPNTPAAGPQYLREKLDEGLKGLGEQDDAMEKSSASITDAKPSKTTTESGSDSGGTKGEIKLRSTSTAPAPSLRPNTVPPTKSYSTGGTVGRGKPSCEGSTKSMTVETETVSSIPQVAVGGGTGGQAANGNLRAKPSSETIRPKKEKKKSVRKAPSVTSGAASSKADIFEAKIASAVDEADSSDSEETFVYESNPPEPSNNLRRYHSRTPSATSMASQLDQRGNSRSVHGVDGQHSVAMKKSMKFANSYNNPAPEAANGEDDGKGTGRSNMGTGRGTTHHHHIGRWGRNGGNGHPSLFDNESPFPNVAKSKLGGNTSRHSSRPTSPRVTKFTNGKRGSPNSYDFDDGAGADDERTPLMNSTPRSNRSGRNRRPGSSSLRHLERQAEREEQSLIARFSGCLTLFLMLVLVIGGAFGFMYTTTQPLHDVKIIEFKNVLVSQEELMLDMVVTARNPNVVVVNIDSMNVEVFARSKHADDWDWFKFPDPPVMRRVKRTAQVIQRASGDLTDNPEAEDPDETQTLKLGQVLEFDSPLSFEGSPFSNVHTNAIGGIRIKEPGNTTESGGADGMEKWSKVLKYEFDLRVKGVLEYQLPLSPRIRKVSVDYSKVIKPGKNTGPEDGDAKKHLHFGPEA